MGSWFNDVFLPSLFEQVGTGSKWLSWRQTAICIDNMERRIGRYETIWQDRIISLHISDWTGRGRITFSQSEDEFQMERESYRVQMKSVMPFYLEDKLKRNREGFLQELRELSELMADCLSAVQQATAENDLEEVENGFLAYQDYREQLQIMQQLLARENR